MRVSVEVCVASLAEARAAIAAGVDSIEACAWLACGGVTPSSGFVERVGVLRPRRLRVLCRPGPGGFRYSQEEIDLVASDALLLSGFQGVTGLVAGGFNQEGHVPWSAFGGLLGSGKEVSFHRAIDHAHDMLAVLDECVAHGVHRVLTSGGETLAMDGSRMIRRMVVRAEGRAVIAAAGGVHAGNVVELVERTGVTEIHFAAQKPRADRAEGASMSSSNAGMDFSTEPDEAKIEGVLNALVKAGLR